MGAYIAFLQGLHRVYLHRGSMGILAPRMENVMEYQIENDMEPLVPYKGYLGREGERERERDRKRERERDIFMYGDLPVLSSSLIIGTPQKGCLLTETFI